MSLLELGQFQLALLRRLKSKHKLQFLLGSCFSLDPSSFSKFKCVYGGLF
jgi:hypothetical protein